MEAKASKSERINAVLAGDAGCLVGLTHVPLTAMRGLRWGRAQAIGPLVAVAERLKPDLMMVSASEPWAAEAADRILEAGVEVFWSVEGPLSRVAKRQGWALLLRSSVSEPARTGSMLEESMHDAEEQVRRGIRLGAAAIVVADDLAGADGPLLSPDFALDEVIPRCGRLAALASESPVPAVFHSCGDVRPYLSALRRAGFAAVHPGGPGRLAFKAVYDAARECGLAVLGGVDGESLRAGGPATERAASEAVLSAGRGGLLITDDGGISTSEELASYVSVVQAVRRACGGSA